MTLPLHSQTPFGWGEIALADPIALLIDHAFLEKKAATNALDLLTRWPHEYVPGWVEILTGVARDEASHLAQVTKLLAKRGGRLPRSHRSSYANALRSHVRTGVCEETVDRLLISALIEARSCERFAVLSAVCEKSDLELHTFYKGLYASEMGHHRVFLHLAFQSSESHNIKERWQDLLRAEANILALEAPGSRILSGYGV